jgi:hypothetical protein
VWRWGILGSLGREGSLLGDGLAAGGCVWHRRLGLGLMALGFVCSDDAELSAL